MSKYNGYPTWAQWNVSLWILNDEGLYRVALDCVRQCKHHGRREAARAMLDTLAEIGVTQTPDGAKYTITGILAVMRGM